MKVLIMIDYWGWAFDFVSRGIQKYSKHDVEVKRWNEIDMYDFRRHDVLFCMNSSCWNSICRLKPKMRFAIDRFPIKKCVGIRAVNMDCNKVLRGWNIGCVSQRIYDELKQQETPNLFLTRNGVDTEIFKPVDRPRDRFIVGWAGNSKRLEKRFGLLQHVNYPLIVQSNYGEKYFLKGRSRQRMVDFYKKIDVFINVSSSEGMPQSILEAAASGLPVIATDVGDMPSFVDSEWIIPVEEQLTIKGLNGKLKMLHDNPELKMQVGESNLQKVLNRWSWKHIVEDYDRMFEG